jgi:hypothetical protein
VNPSTQGCNNHNFTRRNSIGSTSSSQDKKTRFPHFNIGSCGTCQKQFSYHGGRGYGAITCFQCGGPNHKTDRCFASDEDQYKAFATIKIGEIAEEIWYSDTSTNHHMTSNTNEVQGINSYLGNDSVIVGNGHDLPITSTGHIIFLTTNMKLNDVHVVPAIKKKLSSVSQFTRENNCYFLFYP